jgi:hypothetical protein
MRVAFLLVYNRHSYCVHFLGQYWKTPLVSLYEEGDFMQKNKDICTFPYYCAVDEKITQLVHNALYIALPLLHREMLHSCSNLQEESYTAAKRKKLHIVLQEANNSSQFISKETS